MKVFKVIVTTFFLLNFQLILKSQDSLSKIEILKALNILNQVRKNAGLDTVKISDKLSLGCFKHAKYLVKNRKNKLVMGMLAHKENFSLPYSSKEGLNSGKNAVIHYIKPSLAINGWISTFYHRIPLLQSNLKEIGIGYYIEDGYEVTVLDCISKLSNAITKDVVFYPNENESEIPLAMGPEIPHPVGKEGEYGFPITIFFSNYQKINKVELKITDNNNNIVKCYYSDTERPATSFPQWNTICAIPMNKLKPKTKYRVSLSCYVNNKKFVKEYSFFTIE